MNQRDPDTGSPPAPGGPLAAAGRFVLDVVFPPACVFCDAPLDMDHARAQLCAPCAAKIPWLVGAGRPALCIRCGDPMPEELPPDPENGPVLAVSENSVAERPGEAFPESETSPKNRLCGMCLKKRPRYHQARAACRYADPVREAILALKYSRRLDLTGPLTRMLSAARDEVYADEAPPTLITAVPLHVVRLRLRHFDQARVLATRLARQTGSAAAPDLLRRVRDTSSQRGLSRRQRRENVRGAFSIRQPGRCEGAHVLLIDDVYTTGATVNECAKVLLREGKAARVDVLCVARAVKS